MLDIMLMTACVQQEYIIKNNLWFLRNFHQLELQLKEIKVMIIVLINIKIYRVKVKKRIETKVGEVPKYTINKQNKKNIYKHTIIIYSK